MSLADSFTVDKMKDAKYVIIELAQKSENSEHIVGYFLGLRGLVDTSVQIIDKKDIYIWIMKGETVHILNLEQYKIDSIYTRTDDSSVQHSAATEELSLERVKTIQAAMIKANRIRPNGLIDTDKFIEVPPEVKKKVEDDVSIIYQNKGSQSTSKGVTRSTAGYGNSYAAGYVNPPATYKRKTVSTTTFKRTTKYPITAAVEKMREKIVAIQENTYTPPKLPEIPGDKIKEDGKKSSYIADEQQHWDEVYGDASGYPIM